MKLNLLLILLFYSISISAQERTRIDTIHSEILNEDRYIWIHTPDKATGESTYPVIYILDGQVLFDEVINVLKRLSKETGKNIVNEFVVVGIGNIWQRYKDYSPTKITSSPWVDSYSASISGGGEKFISFLEDELFSHIRSRYPVSSEFIIIGHSLGGLMVSNIMLKHPAMFQYYAAIDPSMWWDDQKLLNESKAILASKTFENRKLFLAIANTKEMDMDIMQIRKDTSVETALIKPSISFVDYITNNAQNELIFHWKFYKDHHHMTVPGPAIYDALIFFFNYK